MKDSSFEEFLLLEKGSLNNLTTTTDSMPQEAQGIRKLGCKRTRNKEKQQMMK